MRKRDTGHALIHHRLWLDPGFRSLSAAAQLAWFRLVCQRGDVTEVDPVAIDELERTGWVERRDDVVDFVDRRFIGRLPRRPDARAFLPAKLRRSVYERDGYRCVVCGDTEPLTLDHIHPWSLGGPDSFENLQTLCRSCNSRKGARV